VFGVFAIPCVVVVVFVVVVAFIFVVDKAIIVNMYIIISPRLGLERLEYIQRERADLISLSVY